MPVGVQHFTSQRLLHTCTTVLRYLLALSLTSTSRVQAPIARRRQTENSETSRVLCEDRLGPTVGALLEPRARVLKSLVRLEKGELAEVGADRVMGVAIGR